MFLKLKEKIIKDLSGRLVDSEDKYIEYMKYILDKCLIDSKKAENEDYEITYSLRPYYSKFSVREGDFQISEDSQFIADLLVFDKKTKTKHMLSNLIGNFNNKEPSVTDLLSDVVETHDDLNNLQLVTTSIFSNEMSFNRGLEVGLDSKSSALDLHSARMEIEDPLINLSISSVNFSFLSPKTLENIGMPRNISEDLSLGWFSELEAIYDNLWEQSREWVSSDYSGSNLLNKLDKVELSRVKFIVDGKTEQAQEYRLEFLNWCDEVLGNYSDSLFNNHKLPEAIINSSNSTKDKIVSDIDRGAFPFQLVLQDYLPDGFKPKVEHLKRLSTLRSLISPYYFNSFDGSYQKLLGSIACSEFVDYEKTVDLFSKKDFPQNSYAIFKSVSETLENIREGNGQLKNEKNKWSWLLKGDSYAENIDFFNEKYKAETLSDLGKILSIYSTTVERRLMLEKAEKLEVESDIFRIDSDLDITIDEDLYESENTRVAEEKWEEFNDEYDEEECFDFEDIEVEHDTPSSIPDHVLSSICKSDKRYKQQCETSIKLHKTFTKLNSNLGDFHSRDITWSPLCDDVDMNGLRITNITSRRDLLTLGDELKHCAYTYLDKCMTGESSIFEIRDKDTDKILTSFEIEFDEDKEEFISKQHYGFDNNKVLEGSREFIAHDMFLKEINSDGIDYDRDIELENEDILSSVGDDSDTLESARILSRYDFGTDAAHLCFFAITSNIDAEQYLDSLIMNNLADHDSKFLKEIELISEASKEFGVTPFKIIETKLTKGILSYDNSLKELLSKNKTAELTI